MAFVISNDALIEAVARKGVSPLALAVLRDIVTTYGTEPFNPGLGDISVGPVASVTRRLTELKRVGVVFEITPDPDWPKSRLYRLIGFDGLRLAPVDDGGDGGHSEAIPAAARLRPVMGGRGMMLAA